MSAVEEVLLGAVSKGVNSPTLVALNAALAAALLALVFILTLVWGSSSVGFLVPHIVGLLVVLVLLAGLINWLVLSQGLVSSEEQQEELFGSGGGGEREGRLVEGSEKKKER